MPFFEDDLRSALRRKDPGEHFSPQVLAKLRREQEAALPVTARPRRALRHKLAWAGALLTLIVVTGWAGVAQHRRIEQQRARELAERQASELAERQAMFALRFTAAELNHVFERVEAAARDQSNVQSNPGGKYEAN